MATEVGKLLLLDNDAFVLLAGSGHLEAVLNALGLTLDDARYNAPLPFVFRKKIKSTLPEPVAKRIAAAIERVAPLELAPSSPTQQQLQDVDDIDVGEAILFGVLAEHETTLLTTNDKRALRALSNDERLINIREAVCGRIISVESIIKRLINDNGVDAVADGFIEVSVTDTRLSVIFSEHNLSNPSDCLEAIESYLRDAINQCGDDFFHAFE